MNTSLELLFEKTFLSLSKKFFNNPFEMKFIFLYLILSLITYIIIEILYLNKKSRDIYFKRIFKFFNFYYNDTTFFHFIETNIYFILGSCFIGILLGVFILVLKKHTIILLIIVVILVIKYLLWKLFLDNEFKYNRRKGKRRLS